MQQQWTHDVREALPRRALRTDFAVIPCGKDDGSSGATSSTRDNLEKKRAILKNNVERFRTAQEERRDRNLTNLGFHRCLICQGIILKKPANEEDAEVRCQRPCSAYFHLKCIRVWLGVTDKCPQCKIAPFFVPPPPLVDGVLRPREDIQDDEFVRCLRANSATLVNLKECNLQWCGALTDTSLRALGQTCPRLQSLNLHSYAKFTSAGFYALTEQCQDLRSLTLDLLDFVNDDCLRMLVQHCPRLQSIKLFSNKNITDTGLQHLTRLPLQEFDIDMCARVSRVGVIALIRACPDLRYLAVREPRLMDKNLVQMPAKCPELRSLILQGSYLTDVGLQAIGARCPHLETLQIFNCQGIKHEGLIAIAQGCPQLKDVDLTGARRLRDRGVCALAQLPLNSLYLHTCKKITDKSLRALGRAPAGKHLKFLNLCGCVKITDAGVMALAPPVSNAGASIETGLPRLESLNLVDCEQVTYAGAAAVAQRCTLLKTLNLDSISNFRALQAAHPNIEMTRRVSTDGEDDSSDIFSDDY